MLAYFSCLESYGSSSPDTIGFCFPQKLCACACSGGALVEVVEVAAHVD